MVEFQLTEVEFPLSKVEFALREIPRLGFSTPQSVAKNIDIPEPRFSIKLQLPSHFTIYKTLI